MTIYLGPRRDETNRSPGAVTFLQIFDSVTTKTTNRNHVRALRNPTHACDRSEESVRTGRPAPAVSTARQRAVGATRPPPTVGRRRREFAVGESIFHRCVVRRSSTRSGFYFYWKFVITLSHESWSTHPLDNSL